MTWLTEKQKRLPQRTRRHLRDLGSELCRGKRCPRQGKDKAEAKWGKENLKNASFWSPKWSHLIWKCRILKSSGLRGLLSRPILLNILINIWQGHDTARYAGLLLTPSSQGEWKVKLKELNCRQQQLTSSPGTVKIIQTTPKSWWALSNQRQARN